MLSLEDSYPDGFWPDPRTDMFEQSRISNSPPWEVPRKRKNRGNRMYYFDLYNEDLMKFYDGEVTTASKFETQVEEPIKDPMAHKNTNPTIRKISRRMIQEPQDDNPSNTHMLQKDSRMLII